MTELHLFDPSDLLTAFIHNYNNEQELNEKTSAELIEYKLNANVLADTNKQLKQQVAQQDNDLVIANRGLVDAQKLVNTTATQKAELTRVREQLSAMQKELTALNSQKNLKDQIKRTKEKNAEKDKTIKRLNLELSQEKHALTLANNDKVTAKALVEIQRIALENNNAQGLYHNGDHHLVIWPQTTKMQRADGSEFNGTNLLYLHQSGRGGFITFDPQDDMSKLCTAPKAGLRPSADTLKFAHNWLYKINQSQQGVIKDDDRATINYNK
jgi:hypothetical protein